VGKQGTAEEPLNPEKPPVDCGCRFLQIVRAPFPISSRRPEVCTPVAEHLTHLVLRDAGLAEDCSDLVSERISRNQRQIDALTDAQGLESGLST
jgi:hypothetical protein